MYIFNTFCLSEEMKDKCIAIIQKQITTKIFIWWRGSNKLRRESEKTLAEWFWRVLARLRLEDSRRILKPGVSLLQWRVNQKKIKTSWTEYVTWMCFKIWIKNIFQKL